MPLPQVGEDVEKSWGEAMGQEPWFLLPRRDKGKIGKRSQESSHSNDLIISQLACAMLKGSICPTWPLSSPRNALSPFLVNTGLALNK